MVKRLILLSLFCVAAWAENPVLEDALPSLPLCPKAFRAIFHNVSPNKGSVSRSRKELRVAVTQDSAKTFFTEVREILGDDPATTAPEALRLQLRDVPTEPGTMFITESDYLPTFKATNAKGDDIHKARIRIRKYHVVPNGTSVEELKNPEKKLPRSKIADGEGEYVKLEFKVGKPMQDESGELIDTVGVVDKPSITLLESDVALLVKDITSFKENYKAVADRAKAVTLTKEGTPSTANDPGEIDAMIARIGALHEQGWEIGKLQPQTNMKYVRVAHRVFFKNPDGGAPLEVQITEDRDILQTYLRSGVEEGYQPGDRIIELKIPEAYADLSDKELEKKGLGELAEIRRKYLALVPLEGTKRDGGKPRNLIRRNRARNN